MILPGQLPNFLVGETYELFDDVQLIVISEAHMVIFGSFGILDVTYDELRGLWSS